MKKNLSLPILILIITTTVYSFSSMTTAFFMMGAKSLPWFLISASFYFIPYAIIVAQYTRKYAAQSGTIYDWLRESLSPKAAFVTAFLWYCSYFTWMVSLFMKLMIPLSILLFGQDLTHQTSWWGLSTQFWLAVSSVGALCLLTFLINRGFQTVISFLKISSFSMLGLVVLSFGSNLFLIGQHLSDFLPNIQHSITADSFFAGTGNSFLSQIPFFIFSITAFGGLDTVASLTDRTKKSTQRFPKAVILSTGIVTLLYFAGIILWSGAHNLNALHETDQMHLGNLMYGLMGSTADQLSQTLGLSVNQSQFLYQLFIRYTAFTLFTAYISLLSSITYGPLKSLVRGTPKELWPKNWSQLNKQQMPEKAMWLQAGLLSAVIIVLSFNNQFLADLFNQLTYMTNVARALPYFVVAMSFPFFLKKELISPKERMLKKNTTNFALSFSVCLCILLAIGFQVYEPLRAGNYLNFSSLLLGPTLFGCFAFYLYKKFERKQTKKISHLSRES